MKALNSIGTRYKFYALFQKILKLHCIVQETIKLLQNLLLFRIKEFHKLICFIKYYNKLDKSKTIRQFDPSLFF